MSALTPLGERTKKGFEDKYGKAQGDKKFAEAMDKGLIDRGKMENVGLADARKTPPAEGSPAEEAAESPDDELNEDEMSEPVMAATPVNPSGGSQPRAKRAPAVMPARGAPGKFQKRPG